MAQGWGTGFKCQFFDRLDAQFRPSAIPMLRLEHIRKIYPTGEVLKDVNWEVKPEERVGVVGVNWAG